MRILSIISQSLSFDILSCSLQAKFLTIGFVSKRPMPIIFIVRFAGLICFTDWEFKKSWCFSKRYRISLRFKNGHTESVLRLKTTIPFLSYVQYRTKTTKPTKIYMELCRFWLEYRRFLVNQGETVSNSRTLTYVLDVYPDHGNIVTQR